MSIVFFLKTTYRIHADRCWHGGGGCQKSLKKCWRTLWMVPNTKVELFKTNTDNHHKRLDLFSWQAKLCGYIHISNLATTKVFFPLVDRKSMFNIVYCKCIIFGSNKFDLGSRKSMFKNVFWKKQAAWNRHV